MAIQLPAQYEAARKALAQAVKVGEIKKVRDVAVAIEALAKQAKDPELANLAVQLKADATCKLGIKIIEDSKAGKLAKAGRKGKNRVFKKPDLPSLDEQGVDKNLANAARSLGKVYLKSPDKYYAKVRRMGSLAGKLVSGISAVVKEAKAEKHAEKKAARAKREKVWANKIIELPDEKAGVIYADPEWKFETYSEEGKLDTSAEMHYQTSPIDVIKTRPVKKKIAADDCVLFLWATVPMLTQALEVMDAWDFEYKTHVIWNKDRTGTGYWFMNKHEILLVGTRGKIVAPSQGDLYPSVIDAPRGKHSEKPAVFYEVIEKYFPNVPKIELNARIWRKGWMKPWGYEAPEKEAAE